MADTSSPNTGSPAISALRLPDTERVTSGGSSRLVRFIVWSGILVVVVVGVGAYRRNPPWLQEIRASVLGNSVEFDTATVAAKGREEVALEVSGFVVPYRVLNVSPRIPGLITKLNFEVGQKVNKGDVLAQLDDSSYQYDLQQAEAAVQASHSRLEEATNGAQPEEINQARIAVNVAKSKLELVSNELKRAEMLGDSTTDAEMDQLTSAKSDAEAQVASLQDKLKLIEQGLRPERMKAIEAEVKQTEALVNKAKYFLENTKILAPLNGTVLEKNAEVGEILRPEVLSVSLCKLADMSVMEVEIDVQERELFKIEIGRECVIIPDAYQDKSYAGKIDRLQPMVNRQRGVVRVTIRIENPDEYLLPEMNVRVKILNPPETESSDETLWIPEAAVKKEGDKAYVFMVVNDAAKETDIELGAKEGRRVEVKSGLAAGDVVVIPGDKRVVEGQQIRTKAGK
ncbi:efflux RND transporter periplasmic adaptor subunit [bacterium]|nr:efflux RND transporter periplasmic adaptor subunit [bacterium]